MNNTVKKEWQTPNLQILSLRDTEVVKTKTGKPVDLLGHSS